MNPSLQEGWGKKQNLTRQPLSQQWLPLSLQKPRGQQWLLTPRLSTPSLTSTKNLKRLQLKNQKFWCSKTAAPSLVEKAKGQQVKKKMCLWSAHKKFLLPHLGWWPPKSCIPKMERLLAARGLPAAWHQEKSQQWLPNLQKLPSQQRLCTWLHTILG